MKQLRFVKQNNLSKLHDELLATIPQLRPVLNAQGQLEPVMRVEGLAQDIWLTVPDTADELAIAAVILAHNAQALQPLTAEQQAWATATVAEKLSMIAKRLGLEQ